MMRLSVSALLLVFLLTSVLPTVSAQKVEEITDFRINVELNGNAHIRYDITIKNLIDNPVVPGIEEIRLQKVRPLKVGILPIPFTEQRMPVKVENLKVYSRDRVFKSSVVEKGDYTAIIYEIWYPVEPGKTLNFTVEYDADIVDSGLLFKTVTIPVGTDIDIKKLEITVNSDWNLCYADPKPSGSNPTWQGSIPKGGIAFYTAEFSVLPLPILPVRGYIVFWGSLLAIIVVLAIIGLRRR
ncbi:hypothetical protein [Archaeoglobus sp.]